MIKTQFMSFWDGLITKQNCQIMIMGATNRPQDVDAAILRRMPCAFRIGMPVSGVIQSFAMLTLSHLQLLSDASQKTTFENIVAKGEIAQFSFNHNVFHFLQ